MKFDKIIQNPPYKQGLHLKFLAEAIKHLKDEKSVCVNLGPGNWLAKHNINNPISIKWKNIFNHHISNIETIPHCASNSFFGTANAILELAITTSTICNSKLDLFSYGFVSNVEKSLYQKINIFTNENVISFYRCCDKPYGLYYSNEIKNLRKGLDVPVYQWHGGSTCKDAVIIRDSKKKVSMALCFNSYVECENFINSLDTTFMNFYYRMFVVPGDYKIRSTMFRMYDYSQPWSDERFKEFFKFTDEEWKYIEDMMEKYK